MTIEQTFYYNGLERLNLFWASPNHAGAFLAIVVCLCWLGALWAKGKARLIPLLLLIPEILVLTLLCHTFSRGALVGYLAAWSFFLVQLLVLRVAGWRFALGVHFSRVAALLVLAVSIGFIGRVTPEFVVGDASVTNRVTLWQGGLQLITLEPLTGWGTNATGAAFMNWLQPFDQDSGYRGMVNTYLNWAAENGLPFFALILALLLLPLFLNLRSCWIFQRQKQSTHQVWPVMNAVAGAMVTAFLITLIFSTLSHVVSLWALFAVASLITLVCWGWGVESRRWRVLRDAGILAAAGAIAASVILWGSGLLLLNRESPRLVSRDGVMLLQSAGVSGLSQHVLLVPDEKVLGETYGKEIRRLAAEWVEQSVAVPAPEAFTQALRTFEPAEVLLFGDACLFLEDTATADLKQVTLIHPTHPPEKCLPASQGAAAKSLLVILPEFDEAGVNSFWREWEPAGMEIEIRTTPFSGLDIRREWPHVLTRERK